MRRILLTGAAGSLGSMLRHSLPRGGEIYRFSDIRPFACEAEDDVRIGDLADLDFAMDVTRDVDAIVHMAGNAKESPWDKLIGPNIIAVTNLWEAARANGVRRIVESFIAYRASIADYMVYADNGQMNARALAYTYPRD